MTPAERSAAVLAFVRKQAGAADVEADTLLVSTGILDSLQLNQLLVFLETIGVEVEEGDVTLDNLDSVDRIVAMAERATPPG